MERRRDAELKREQMQANLMEASRRAGMADVATGVLHNVETSSTASTFPPNFSTIPSKPAASAIWPRPSNCSKTMLAISRVSLPRISAAKPSPVLEKLSQALSDEHATFLKSSTASPPTSVISAKSSPCSNPSRASRASSPMSSWANSSRMPSDQSRRAPAPSCQDRTRF